MRYPKNQLTEMLRIDQFPRSANYDPQWVIDTMMGPNVLWLTESLSQILTLKPGMRVLDLGCGRAASSVFLAKEFDLQVWATDLWIDASDNWDRIRQAGLEKQIFPIHAEAHTLPFAKDFFDAIVSMDAYHYFGTDNLYLGYITQFLKPKGQIGIVVPGLTAEFEEVPPEHLLPYWVWDFCSFHSPSWWKRNWLQTGKVEVEVADMIPDGWKHWLKWQEVHHAHTGSDGGAQEAEMLRTDAGRNLGFTRMVARRKDQ